MTEVLFVKPGAIKPRDKAKLSKAGVVVVEVENPADAKFVTPAVEGGNLPGGDLLAAYARGVLRTTGYTQAAFAEEISKAVIKAHRLASEPSA